MSANHFDIITKTLTRSALDAIASIVDKLADPKAQETVLVLNLKTKSQKCILESSGGVQFLESLGYSARSGFYCLKSLPDSSVISSARSALIQGTSAESYQIESALEESIALARAEASAARESMRMKQPVSAPEEGLASLRVVVHIANETHPLERRFSPDDRLCDVVHWLATTNDKGLEKSHSFQFLGNAMDVSDSRCWWCHGWELSDITTRPSRSLNVADVRKTLHALGLWPSAHLRLCVKELEFATPEQSRMSPKTFQASRQALGASNRRPKPSELMAMSASQSRFGTEAAVIAPRDHFNVNGKLVRSRA